MLLARTFRAATRRIRGRALSVWYEPDYRVPLPSFEASTGATARRADFVLWYLLERGIIDKGEVQRPDKVSYQDLLRVHTPELLDAVTDPKVLADVFGVDPAEVVVDEVLASARLATQGTIDAMRDSMLHRRAALNLLGGFHHATPDRAAGNCVFSDIAVAIRLARAEGAYGHIVVFDLDAHPPDGLARCLRPEDDVWIGSLSGSDFGPLPGVDETLLPAGCGDQVYLEALGALLRRMPEHPVLAFVIAGGDVLAGDRFGRLGLTLAGARERDLEVIARLEGTPSVWLPGGGYHPDAWRLFAGTVRALRTGSRRPISRRFDPMRARFGRIFRTIPAHLLSDDDLRAGFSLSQADVEENLRLGSPAPRFLDFYTATGIEFGLSRYRVLEYLERLGYAHFRVAVDRSETGDRARVFARVGELPTEHLLVELVLEKRRIGSEQVLFVHWLTLRHPRAAFSGQRPKLPGQDAPGLGIAAEVAELVARMALRLGLSGVAFQPTWFHVAFAARARFRFVDPERQGRFEALVRDTVGAGMPLLDATQAVAAGRMLLNGEPYRWEPDEMRYRFGELAADDPRVADARERAQFRLGSVS